MTTPARDEVIQMAREAGFTPQRGECVFTEMLERFAAIVAAAAYARGQEDMRERCAKLCESMEYEFKAGHECAAAIRALSIQKGGGT